MPLKNLIKGKDVMGNNKSNFFNRNFFIRSLSTIVLAPIILLIIHLGGFIFYMTVAIMAILMAFEWNEMLRSKTMKHSLLWKIIAIFYIAIPCSSLIWVMTQHHGNRVIAWLILTIWVTDIMAYIVGRSVGGPKLLPKISPNKTWSGLIGGCASAAVFSYFAGKYIGTHHPKFLILLTISLAIYAQIGDLIESWIKRIFEIKDSGNIIPGHGGILDRVDGIILTAPKVALVLFFDHWHLFKV
jgi:phosphatidate cytidylyltransferase